MTGLEGEDSPRFYMKDMISILKERNELKERVLELEEQVLNLKADVVRLSNFGTLTLSPKTVHLQRIKVDEDLEPAGTGDEERTSRTTAAFQKQFKSFEKDDAYKCITDVEVTEYEKKGRNYVYVVKLTWSDGQRFEVYRRYGEFFTLQNTLLQYFPEGGRGDGTIIPLLPTIDNALSLFGRTNTESVIKARLSTINEYCQILLLHMDERILKISCVLNFFRPTIGDKQLTRLKRSAVSNMELSILSIYPQNIPAGSLFEEYVVIADYKGSTVNELEAKAGDRVKVIKKEVSGWWLVVKETEYSKGETGFISSEYLKPYRDYELKKSQKIEQKEASHVDNNDEVTCHEMRYVAIESYSTDDPWQLGFNEGETIFVIEKSEDGWWLAINAKKQGWVPGSYLSACNEEGGLEMDEENLQHSEEDHASGLKEGEEQRGEDYIVVTGYNGEERDDISFPEGAIVEVLDKSVSGWWIVRYMGKTGVAPASFLALPSTSPLPGQGPLSSSLGQNSIDMGHCISGITAPPPRSQVFLRHTEKRISRARKSAPRKAPQIPSVVTPDNGGGEELPVVNGNSFSTKLLTIVKSPLSKRKQKPQKDNISLKNI